MFKLVGTEQVTIGRAETNCVIKIEPYGGFSYQYSLEVNGKAYKTFTEQQAKVKYYNSSLNIHTVPNKTTSYIINIYSPVSTSDSENVDGYYIRRTTSSSPRKRYT